ncbi:MAG: DUF5320 domain-containing protein [Candidatus Omnitrophota bacterium]
MPRGDGTGPMGLGPMTGRGAGYCAGYATPGYVNPVPSRGFGRGRRNWYYATGLTGWQRASMGIPSFGGMYPYPPEVTPREEMDILKNQADLLKKQLEDIQNRIDGLGKTQTERNE